MARLDVALWDVVGDEQLLGNQIAGADIMSEREKRYRLAPGDLSLESLNVDTEQQRPDKRRRQ